MKSRIVDTVTNDFKGANLDEYLSNADLVETT